MASARSGAGYTRLVTTKSAAECARNHLLSIPVSACIEGPAGALCPGSIPQVKDALCKSVVLLIGPGMGMSNAAIAFLDTILADPEFAQRPIVLDADALNILAEHPEKLAVFHNPFRILTPHEGEAARLLGRPLIDRNADVCTIASMFKSTVLLKGPDTLIATPNGDISVMSEGGPELAKAGSGDVLGGIIAALMSQGLTAADSALLGAYVHARAGKMAARKMSVHAVMPEDIINKIGPALLSMEA